VETKRLTGTQSSDPSDPQSFHSHIAAFPFCSVKHLESQITELEAETERLSRSLEAQKALTTEVEQNGLKKAEQINHELQKRVAEVEHLKQRLERFSDYDEIKRELDIMKVRIYS
jgi:predicted RNase H-like nuclease (RuvC/YqgF family)